MELLFGFIEAVGIPSESGMKSLQSDSRLPEAC
jgi:hypothetical protein